MPGWVEGEGEGEGPMNIPPLVLRGAQGALRFLFALCPFARNIIKKRATWRGVERVGKMSGVYGFQKYGKRGAVEKPLCMSP